MSHRWAQLTVSFASMQVEMLYTTNKTVQHGLCEYLFWNTLKLLIIILILLKVC